MVIETERLLLREMTEEDFPALYKVSADSYAYESGGKQNESQQMMVCNGFVT